MSEESSPAPILFAAKEQAEDLEWTGTAYGRPETPAPSKEFGRASLVSLSHWLASQSRRAQAAVAGHEPAAISTLVVLLVVVSALATVWGLAPANVAKAPPPDVIAAAEPAPHTTAQQPAARADRILTEAKTQLTTEHEAPIPAEAHVAEYASASRTETVAGNGAERATAEARAPLEIEHSARTEWEHATRATDERLAPASPADDAQPVTAAQPSPVSGAAPAPDPVVPTEPAREPLKSADAAPEITKAKPGAAGPQPNARIEPDIAVWVAGEATPVEAKAEFLKGEQRFAKGDLAAARRHFARAAALGMAEGALACGNTYDQVSLTKAGLKFTGDPERARVWYRRAYEIAQRQSSTKVTR